MTSFNFEEILEIWEVEKETLLILRHRDKQAKYSALDSLFLLLIFVKQKPNIELFGHQYIY